MIDRDGVEMIGRDDVEMIERDDVEMIDRHGDVEMIRRVISVYHF